MADPSRDWVDHMLDTQHAGAALSASASVTAFQQPDLTLSNKKISPSVDPRKTPTPTSQEAKRSLSQSNTGGGAADAPAAKPAAAPNAPSSVSKSQGRSQSSGPAPSWKTPSMSSIPTQMSEDPAEVAAINTGINKMVTELKGQQRRTSADEAEMETTDSGIEDLTRPAGELRRSSSSASERLKEKQTQIAKAAVPRQASGTATKASEPFLTLDDEDLQERVKKERVRKQLSLQSLSTQGSGRGTEGFSTQGSEYIAEEEDDEEGGVEGVDYGAAAEPAVSPDRRISPRGRRSEAMTVSKLIDWRILPVNSKLFLGKHEAIVLKNGWLDHGDHDPAPSLQAWAEAVLPRKTKVTEEELWGLVTVNETGPTLAELASEQPHPAREALLAAIKDSAPKEERHKGDDSSKERKHKATPTKPTKTSPDKSAKSAASADKRDKERLGKEEKKEAAQRPMKQLSMAGYTGGPTEAPAAAKSAPPAGRVLPAWAGDGKGKGNKVEAIAASLKAKAEREKAQAAAAAGAWVERKKADSADERPDRVALRDAPQAREKEAGTAKRKESTGAAAEAAHKLKRRVTAPKEEEEEPAPSLGAAEELLEVAADKTPKRPKKDDRPAAAAEAVAVDVSSPPRREERVAPARTPSGGASKDKEKSDLVVRTPAAKDGAKAAREEERERQRSSGDERKAAASAAKDKREKEEAPASDAAAKSATKRARAEGGERVLLSTGLSSLRQEQMAALTKALGGGRVVREFSEEVTHVVAPLKADGLANRTLKYLMGVLRGCWIVSWEWAEACYDQKKWVPEAEFEVKGDNYGIAAPTASRAAHTQRQPLLFHDFQFYFHGEFGTPSKDELVQLVRVGLGSTHLLTSRPPRLRLGQRGASSSQTAAELRPVVIVDKSKTDHEAAREIFFWFGEFPVTVGWLLDSISHYSVRSMADYQVDAPTTSAYATQDSQSL